jgi:hypothetical protein
MFHVGGRTTVPHHSSCALTRIPKEVMPQPHLIIRINTSLFRQQCVRKPSRCSFSRHIHTHITPTIIPLLPHHPGHRYLQFAQASCTTSDATCLRLRRLVVPLSQRFHLPRLQLLEPQCVVVLHWADTSLPYRGGSVRNSEVLHAPHGDFHVHFDNIEFVRSISALNSFDVSDRKETFWTRPTV